MGRERFGNLEPVASHLILLAKVWDISKGDVCELGTGYFSTLLLHWLSTTYGRHVYSYESKKDWYNRAKKYNNKFHHIIYVDNWDTADIEKPWGMAFVDHSPGNRRPKEVNRLAKLAEYVVIHDTQYESDNEYHFSNSFPKFKYKYHYDKILPWTSVVSNFHTLKKL